MNKSDIVKSKLLDLPRSVWRQGRVVKELARAADCSTRMVRKVRETLEKSQPAGAEIVTNEQLDPGNEDTLRLEVKIQQLEKELKRARKEKLTDAEVKRFILKSRANTDDVPVWVPRSAKIHEHGEDVPMTMWSDFHWAEQVRPEEIQGLNRFDMDIAAERLRTLCDNTSYLLTDHLKGRDWPGIIVCLNGDMLSGDIHEELSETNAEDIGPAWIDLRRNLQSALTLMADRFGKVFVPCEFGNHTRTTKKIRHKKAAHKNLDWLLYHELADFMADDDRIKFLIGEGADVQFKVYDHTYRMTHGNQFRGGAGFIGALAPVTRGEHKKRIAVQSYNAGYDTLLIGHFHQCMKLPRVLCNGSLVGYNEFAINNNFSFDEPKQMLWLTNRRLGLVNPLEVYCVEPGQPVNDNSPWVSWEERESA
ncbi:conserved protein of unknown function [Pseudodesulfovibrio profundus]|uniref:Calcineurin-like phosphoesterase domain-containing protein n=1 Tax=Pseudodesulfovibrio profundus TaxID=57320 RepID=A0A2C8FEY1_9BACT|nr:hypothetical protein [Pseudodesulfovibrio profundus]SOB60619.1 conserved protein of unknown function [Pseudodesulfovibrio profundus]